MYFSFNYKNVNYTKFVNSGLFVDPKPSLGPNDSPQAKK